MKTKIARTFTLIQAAIILSILGLTLTAFIGCSRGGKMRKDFPSQHSGEFHHQYNRALHTMRHVGSHRVRETSITARTQRGARKIGGVWCWQVNYPHLPPNLWIAGVYYPQSRRVVVGAHPQTGGEIHWPTVHHEFMHHLLNNAGVQGHNPDYDAHVHNWAYARRVTGQSTASGSIEVETGAGNRVMIRVLDDNLGVAEIHGVLLDPEDVQPLTAEKRHPLFPRSPRGSR